MEQAPFIDFKQAGESPFMAVIDAAEEEILKRDAGRQRPQRFNAADSVLDTNDGDAAFADSGLHTVTLAPPHPGWYEQIYRLIDAKSGGKAAEFVRLSQFLVVGGSASVLNLVCVALFDKLFKPSGVWPVFFVILAATEISLIFNFALNDRFTFRALVSEHRTWLQRCVRFHGPASLGFVLTLLISNGVHNLVTLSHGKHPPLVVGQAIAIVIVTAVNFLMHRHWTYREVSVA
jgi:putative flippase GtrA